MGSPHQPRALPSGLTLAEVLVALAILAILAAILLPSVVRQVGAGTAGGLIGDLRGLSDGVTAFRQDLRRYPRELYHLSTAPGGTDRDACGQLLPDPGRWKGPYVDRAIPRTGIETRAGVVSDTLRRVPPTLALGQVATLFIDVREVDSVVAAEVERTFDGEPLDYNGGAVLWAAGSQPGRAGTLSFGLAIRGC